MISRAAALLLLPLLAGCGPTILVQDPGGGYLGRGDTALVDDGKCPSGQLTQITGPRSLTEPATTTCVKRPSGWF